MAPKAKRAAAKDAASGVRQKSKAQDPGETLVQKQEHQSRNPATRAPRRDLAAKVDRVQKDDFADFSAYQFDVLVRNGMTLRKRLEIDIACRSAQGKSARLSSSYWTELRDMYAVAAVGGTVDDPWALSDEDRELVLDPQLLVAMAAITQSNTTKRSKAPLTQWFQTVRKINKREIVGVGRHMVGVRACSSKSSMELALAFVVFVVRLDVPQNFGNLWQHALRDWVDETFVAAFAAFRKNNLSVADFVTLHQDALPLLVPLNLVHKILACKSAWIDVAAELDEVTAASKLGLRMFGYASTMVAADRMGLWATQYLQGLQPPLSKQMEDTFVEAFSAEALKLKLGVCLASKRMLTLDYRGLAIKVPTQGLAEEPQIRWALMERVSGKGTERLNFETDLFGPIQNTMELHKSCFDRVNHARKIVNQVCEEFPAYSFYEVVTKKAEILMQSGTGAKVDIAIGQALKSEGGDRLLVARILRQFPSAIATMQPDHVLLQLRAIEESKLYSAVGTKAQAYLKSTRDAVAAIKAGRQPDLKTLDGDVMTPVRLRLPCFAFADIEEAKGKVKRVYGKEAIQHEVAALRNHKGDVTFEMVERFHVYDWLLTADERKLVQEKTADAVAKFKSTRKTASSSSSPSVETPVEDQAAKKAKQDQSFMMLFR